MSSNDYFFMDLAFEEAKKSVQEGGIPIGAVLVINDKVISKGHNRMIQKNSLILHGELDALNNAGLLNQEDFKNSTLYTTLSPCPMCAGAIILYKIPRVVIGENETLKGAENLLEKNNVEVKNLNIQKIKDFFKENSDGWNKEVERVGNSTILKI